MRPHAVRCCSDSQQSVVICSSTDRRARSPRITSERTFALCISTAALSVSNTIACDTRKMTLAVLSYSNIAIWTPRRQSVMPLRNKLRRHAFVFKTSRRAILWIRVHLDSGSTRCIFRRVWIRSTSQMSDAQAACTERSSAATRASRFRFTN